MQLMRNGGRRDARGPTRGVAVRRSAALRLAARVTNSARLEAGVRERRDLRHVDAPGTSQRPPQGPRDCRAGVYDMISLRMAAAMGFEALCMTGYGAVASLLGSPTPGSPVMPTLVGRVRGAHALRGALGAYL
jgi:hypothetical protein